MMTIYILFLWSLIIAALPSNAFVTNTGTSSSSIIQRIRSRNNNIHRRFSTTNPTTTTTDNKSATNNDDDTQDDLLFTSKGLLKRDRYIATNRFAVKPGKEAKFEQRWATRKSRLAELDGFRYFHLMRRVDLETSLYDGGSDNDSRQGNYVSFTIWEKKSHFSAWRKGDAFKVSEYNNMPV
jgi:heme-degrading monooxygenase HmoA